jgi:hypothetical protein
MYVCKHTHTLYVGDGGSDEHVLYDLTVPSQG